MRLRLVPVLGRLLLAVALVGAWQAALQHPIEHLDELGELVHLHDGGEKNSEAGPLCDLLASLTACAPDGGFSAAASGPVEPALPFQPESAPRAAEAPPFLAQGPPASV